MGELPGAENEKRADSDDPINPSLRNAHLSIARTPATAASGRNTPFGIGEWEGHRQESLPCSHRPGVSDWVVSRPVGNPRLIKTETRAIFSSPAVRKHWGTSRGPARRPRSRASPWQPPIMPGVAHRLFASLLRALLLPPHSVPHPPAEVASEPGETKTFIARGARAQEPTQSQG